MRTFIQNAEQVGNSLIQKIKDNNVFSSNDIDNHSYLSYSRIFYINSEIYLYLLRLYELTENGKYLNAVIGSIDALQLSSKKNTFDLSLCKERASLIYVLVELYAHTRQEKLASKIEELLAPFYKFNYSEQVNNSLVSGRSGLLITLIKYHRLRPTDANRDRIISLITEIFKAGILSSNEGIYWDWDYNSHKGNCGLNKGVSGIIYALSLLDEEPLVEYIINQGLVYIYNQWDETNLAWKNYDCPISNFEREKKLRSDYSKNGELHEIYKYTHDHSNGSIGIIKILLLLLPRISSSRKDDQKSLIKKGLYSIWAKINDEYYKDTFTHYDLNGILNCLNRINNDRINIFEQEFIREFKHKVIELFKYRKPNDSVDGLVDQGFFFLLNSNIELDIINLPNSAYPKINNTSKVLGIKIQNGYSRLILMLLSKHFKKTINLINRVYPKHDWFRFFLEESSHKQTVVSYLKTVIEEITPNQILMDTFKLENEVLKNLDSIRSLTEIFIEYFYYYDSAQALLAKGDEVILDTCYYLNLKRIKVIITKYDLSNLDRLGGNIDVFEDSLKGEQKVLIRPIYKSPYIKIDFLSDFDLILEHFEEPLIARELYDALLQESNFTSKEEIELLTKKFVKLIITSLQKGILLIK